jgi:hypothetical protein
MIKPDTLRSWLRVVGKFDYYPSSERERQIIDSHLEAHEEIARLRSALKAVQDMLDAIDNGKFDQAIESLGTIRGLAQ